MLIERADSSASFCESGLKTFEAEEAGLPGSNLVASDSARPLSLSSEPSPRLGQGQCYGRPAFPVRRVNLKRLSPEQPHSTPRLIPIY